MLNIRQDGGGGNEPVAAVSAEGLMYPESVLTCPMLPVFARTRPSSDRVTNRRWSDPILPLCGIPAAKLPNRGCRRMNERRRAKVIGETRFLAESPDPS